MSASTTPGPALRPSGGPDCLDPSGRTALVTGAAGGIGRAGTLRPATAGARVRAVDPGAGGLTDLAAAAVAYLCGPHASSITGASLGMDGGWTAR
ncbi:hypothetical protein ACFV4E_40055 [Streptomyces hygroscopicus]|uniref:hypothetical protein n=1 Tax=Streptomyces hygroscopicus TaxID=1912 RepID=UPI0007804D04|nr:hypothetical protein [Streptomyces hygroscopicus]